MFLIRGLIHSQFSRVKIRCTIGILKIIFATTENIFIFSIATTENIFIFSDVRNHGIFEFGIFMIYEIGTC